MMLQKIDCLGKSWAIFNSSQDQMASLCTNLFQSLSEDCMTCDEIKKALHIGVALSHPTNYYFMQKEVFYMTHPMTKMVITLLLA